MPFVDTNSPLTTKPHNFYIRCLLGPSLRVVRIFSYGVSFFSSRRESTLGQITWTFSYGQKDHAPLSRSCLQSQFYKYYNLFKTSCQKHLKMQIQLRTFFFSLPQNVWKLYLKKKPFLASLYQCFHFTC